jgi:hypothetical protein
LSRQVEEPGRAPSADNQAQQLFEAGQRRYARGDYAGARSNWYTALGMAGPERRPMLRFNIALTHLRQGNTTRVEEIAAELIRDGHPDLAARLQELRETGFLPSDEPGAEATTTTGPERRGERPSTRRLRGPETQRARETGAGPAREAEPETYVRGAEGQPRLAAVGVANATYDGDTSSFVVRFNQDLSRDQALEYLWPRGMPLGSGFVAQEADPMAPDSERSSIYRLQIHGPGWASLRPSMHRRLYPLLPGTADVLERRLAHVNEWVRNRILLFEDRATPSDPLAEAWPSRNAHNVYYFDGSRVEVYAFRPPGEDAERFERDAFEMFRRDLVTLVTERKMRVSEARSFLVRSYDEQFRMLVSAFISVLAGASSPGPGPSLSGRLRPRLPRTRRVRGDDDLGTAPTVPAGRTRQELERAPTVPTARAREEVERAPTLPAAGAREELERAPTTPAGPAGSSPRPRRGRPSAPTVGRPTRATWVEVEDLLGANPYAVHRADSPGFHQMAWEGAGGAGSAPPIFRFGDGHLRVDVSRLTPAQSRLLDSLR